MTTAPSTTAAPAVADSWSYGALWRRVPRALGYLVPTFIIAIAVSALLNTFLSGAVSLLVFIVGIFDFLRTIEVARIDPKWATPVTSTTGYAFAAIFYFVCCWMMSRYAQGVERRLATGYKR